MLNEADLVARTHGWVTPESLSAMRMTTFRVARRGRGAAAQPGSGAVFLLEELQFLGRRGLATLAAAMHGVSQQAAPVLLIAAVLPQLPLMLKDAKPHTERLFDHRTIGGLPQATAATALTVPAQRASATSIKALLT
ncbi:MAG TPA: hypothetical protein VIK04_10515 [Solirubrobacteraceae bacterium]